MEIACLGEMVDALVLTGGLEQVARRPNARHEGEERRAQESYRPFFLVLSSSFNHSSMGAEKSKPILADASQITKNTTERENLKASVVVDQRRAAVHRAAKARMSVTAMSGGYNPVGGPVAGFLPGGPALRPPLQDEQLPPRLVSPNNEDTHTKTSDAAPAAAGFPSTALAYGTGVMKDPPKNVFGPGHVVSPDMYPEFHRAAWVAAAGTEKACHC